MVSDWVVVIEAMLVDCWCNSNRGRAIILILAIHQFLGWNDRKKHLKEGLQYERHWKDFAVEPKEQVTLYFEVIAKLYLGQPYHRLILCQGSLALVVSCTASLSCDIFLKDIEPGRERILNIWTRPGLYQVEGLVAALVVSGNNPVFS